MYIRDLFHCEDEEQKQRVDGPVVFDLGAPADPHADILSRVTARLPGDNADDHPNFNRNKYLHLPYDELRYLLSMPKLPSQSREAITYAMRWIKLQGGYAD